WWWRGGQRETAFWRLVEDGGGRWRRSLRPAAEQTSTNLHEPPPSSTPSVSPSRLHLEDDPVVVEARALLIEDCVLELQLQVGALRGADDRASHVEESFVPVRGVVHPVAVEDAALERQRPGGVPLELDAHVAVGRERVHRDGALRQLERGR